MKNIFSLNNDNGLTVIELLLAILILGIVMTAITTMIVQSFDLFDSSTRRMSAGQLAELALDQIALHLRTATSEINEDNGKWQFDGYYVDSDDQVSFEIILDQNQLRLRIDDINKTRIITNNVVENEFYITKNENENEFELYIMIDDDSNHAEKRITVKSRNL